MKRQAVTLQRTRIEVGAMRKGRPSYRWTTGYYLVGPDGVKQYPPMIRREAYTAARSQFPGCVVTVTDE